MAKHIYTQEERRTQFLKTGLTMARKVGATKVTAKAIADKHKVTPPLVFHIFGSRKQLGEALAAEAKKQGVKLPEVAASKARKRSVAEVKAIKDKAAGKRKVSRSAKDGKFVNKATVEANPDTTVTQTVKKPRVRKPKTVAPPLVTTPVPSNAE